MERLDLEKGDERRTILQYDSWTCWGRVHRKTRLQMAHEWRVHAGTRTDDEGLFFGKRLRTQAEIDLQ